MSTSAAGFALQLPDDGKSKAVLLFCREAEQALSSQSERVCQLQLQLQAARGSLSDQQELHAGTLHTIEMELAAAQRCIQVSITDCLREETYVLLRGVVLRHEHIIVSQGYANASMSALSLDRC